MGLGAGTLNRVIQVVTGLNQGRVMDKQRRCAQKRAGILLQGMFSKGIGFPYLSAV